MNRKRILTAVAVLLGALLATQIFPASKLTPIVLVLVDLFYFSLAVTILLRIRPVETLEKGVRFLVLSVLYYLLAFLVQWGMVALIGFGLKSWQSYLESIWIILQFLPTFALVWICLIAFHLGGENWLRYRRRIIIAIVLTAFLILIQAGNWLVFLAGVYVVLWVAPLGWTESLAGKGRWLLPILVIWAPVADVILNGSILSVYPVLSKATLFDPTREVTTLTKVLRIYLALYWIVIPLRIVTAVIQGTYGLRVPIRFKLLFTYIFSTLIPGLLLFAIVIVIVFTGIGTLRSRIVRSLIFEDLRRLEQAVIDRKREFFTSQDSVAVGEYLLIDTKEISEKKERERRFPKGLIPPDPFAPDLRQAHPLEHAIEPTAEERFFQMINRSLVKSTAEEDLVWIKQSATSSLWTIPDTLPVLPGWTNTSCGHVAIIPIGNGRAAYVVNHPVEIGSKRAFIAFQPLNKTILNRYRKIIGADISVHPMDFRSVAQDTAVSSQTSMNREGFSFSMARSVNSDVDTSSHSFWEKPIYHGVCEIQRDDPSPEEKPFGIIVVRSSLKGVFQSLFNPSGLNRIVLYILIVLTFMFFIAVLFSNLLSYGINRTITRAVSILRQGTEKLAKGKLETVIEVRNRDELGSLADSFNQMTQDLRRMLDQMAKKERLEQEVLIARSIQQNLLPNSLPEIPGIDLAGRSEPATEVGGDYFDAVLLPDNRLGIAIADVAGKGVAAAMLMSNLQAAMNVIAREEIKLSEMVERLNQMIYRNSTPEMFITFFLGILDLKSIMLWYINAGHDSPVVIRDGEIIELSTGGLMLGAFPESTYETGNIRLKPGDLVASYTDGLIEAMDEKGVEFNSGRLIQVLQHCKSKPSAEIISNLLQQVRDYAGAERAAMDDLTILILKISDDYLS